MGEKQQSIVRILCGVIWLLLVEIDDGHLDRIRQFHSSSKKALLQGATHCRLVLQALATRHFVIELLTQSQPRKGKGSQKDAISERAFE
jgi:hypothetical protein